MCNISLWSVEYIWKYSILNFHRISNSIEICLVGRAPDDEMTGNCFQHGQSELHLDRLLFSLSTYLPLDATLVWCLSIVYWLLCMYEYIILVSNLSPSFGVRKPVINYTFNAIYISKIMSCSSACNKHSNKRMMLIRTIIDSENMLTRYHTRRDTTFISCAEPREYILWVRLAMRCR